MHKSYSLDMFDERPMEWASPSDQGMLAKDLPNSPKPSCSALHVTS